MRFPPAFPPVLKAETQVGHRILSTNGLVFAHVFRLLGIAGVW